MSVVTTRTSVLSILKIKGENKPSPHRVRFRLPNNVRKIFMDKKNHENTREYENLVCTIRDAEISDGELKKLLEEAKNCIALLDYDLRLFVQALVILGWTHRSAEVIQVYQEFIVNVVSAHPQHSKDVIDQLVKLFSNCDGTKVDISDISEIYKEHEIQFVNIRSILTSIVNTIPLTSDMLLHSLKSNFPYHSAPTEKQQCYIYNVLKMTDCLPEYRREILLILVDRLLNLDVNAAREDITDTTMGACEFAIDDLAPTSSVVESLDFGMLYMFQYFDATCKLPNGELRWAETKSLFADLLEVLNTNLLTTYGSYHVQFLIFYFVSYKSILVQGFLNALWQKVLSPTVPSVVRKMSVAYIASFLARANFISSGFLKTYLSEMTTWIHRYVSSQDTVTKVNREIRAHAVFYAVCQAVFYVIAFRHRDLVDSKKKLVFLQSLNLSKIVTCSLNPLRACVPAVADNFAAVARDHQLAYCYTIMENNSRCFLEKPIPDEFFPFDPYLLKRSGQYITPLYRDYVNETEREDAGVDEPDEGKDEMMETGNGVGAVEDEDDFIGEHSAVEKAMLDFSYSTSPGFKQRFP